MNLTEYLGDMGRLPCPEKRPCQSAICKVEWYKGTNETAVAIHTNFKRTNITKNNTNDGRFYLDRKGTLIIRNLTLGDSGYYTCERTDEDDFALQLDVVGKWFAEIAHELKRSLHSKGVLVCLYIGGEFVILTIVFF